MGKKSAIRRRLRSVQSRFKAAKADLHISETELLNIFNAATKIKLLEPSGRQLKKTDRILSKAAKWFSTTNTTEVVNEVVKEVEVIKEVEVVNEVETPGETVYVDREVVKEIPVTYIIDPLIAEVYPEENQVYFQLSVCDVPEIDFFREGDIVDIEVSATNFALDEIIHWSDYTTQTLGPPNHYLVHLIHGQELDHCTSFAEYVPLTTFPHDMLNLPRTFIVFDNHSQQRQIAIEIDDLVGPVDSVA